MKKLVVILLFALGTTVSYAQMVLYADEVVASPEDQITMNIKTTNFTDVIGIQFSVRWDDTVLEFVEVNNFALPNVTVNSFGGVADPNNPNPDSTHYLTFLWDDGSLAGFDIEDNEAVFSIVFNIIGEANTSSPLDISSSPLFIEALAIVNGSITPISVSSNDGKVDVLLSSLEDPNGLIIGGSATIQPNPFKSNFRFGIEMAESSNVLFKFYSLDGKLIHSKERVLRSGKQQIEFDANIFNSFGTYLLIVENQQFKLTKMLFYTP